MLTHDRLAAVAFGLMIAALIIRGVIYMHEARRNVESILDGLDSHRAEWANYPTPGVDPATQRGDAA